MISKDNKKVLTLPTEGKPTNPTEAIPVLKEYVGGTNI